ncbi:Uncharacterised protein [Mycobacterium tuberculosis]|nr:Uncharacterised protein [Mycobacterium tuberculosis]
MGNVVTPIVAHLLQDSFELFKVGRLLLTNDVDRFSKLVFIFTVEGCSQVTCDIESCTIRLLDEGWMFNSIFLKIDNLGTF